MKAKFIFEKFEQDSDPIEDMGIGAFQMNVEMKGDFEGSEQYEKKKAKSWIFRDIQALKAKGTIDTERVFLYIDLTNDDHIYFEDFYEAGGYKNTNNYASIISPLIGKENVTEDFIEELEQYDGIILCVLRVYQKLLSKKFKKSINEKFEEESDPVKDMGIGGNVNFEQKALKTIRDNKIRNTHEQRIKWLNYLTSLTGKSITGIFDKVPYAHAREKIKKTNRITFVIDAHESVLKGTELYFYNKKVDATSSHDAIYDIYKVLPEEYYLIK